MQILEYYGIVTCCRWISWRISSEVLHETFESMDRQWKPFSILRKWKKKRKRRRRKSQRRVKEVREEVVFQNQRSWKGADGQYKCTDISLFWHIMILVLKSSSHCACCAMRRASVCSFELWTLNVIPCVLFPGYAVNWEWGYKFNRSPSICTLCLSWKIKVRSCDRIAEVDQGTMGLLVHIASSPCFMLVLLSVVSFCVLCVAQDGACFNGERVDGRCQCYRGWTGSSCEHCSGRSR